MTPLEEGKKFTDDVYASKDEVQAYYNVEKVSAYWSHVLSYRSYYDQMTKLENIDSNCFKICLTKPLLSASYRLQNNLFNDLLSFLALSTDKQNHLLLQRKNRALKALARFCQVNEPSEDILNRISLNSIETLLPSYLPLATYSRTYNSPFFSKGITLKDFDEINKGCSSQSEEEEPIYRQNENRSLLNPLQIAKTADIKVLLVSLIDFLNEEEIPLLVRAMVIPFAFSYIKPYEYFYEASAALAAKNFLYSSGLRNMGFLLDFESIAFSRGKEVFRSMKKAQDTLDLTYYIMKCLSFLIEDEKNLKETIQELKNQPEKEEENLSGNQDQEESQKEYALPVFPEQNPDEDIDSLAKKLREVYPQLKKKEAHFYAGHCTIGLKYTIDDFKTAEKSVYETARSNMDELARLGFYKKEKFKNKFVYSPIPKKEKIQ